MDMVKLIVAVFCTMPEDWSITEIVTDTVYEVNLVSGSSIIKLPNKLFD